MGPPSCRLTVKWINRKYTNAKAKNKIEQTEKTGYNILVKLQIDTNLSRQNVSQIHKFWENSFQLQIREFEVGAETFRGRWLGIKGKVFLSDVLHPPTYPEWYTLWTFEIFNLLAAMNVLDEALQISRELKMEKEIEGINDRRRNIQDLIERGLLWLNQRPVQNHGARNEPCERDTDDFEDLLENMLLFETEQNRRREDQCSE